MNRGVMLAGATGMGAGLMYLLDPDTGARRRALVRDKAVHALHKTGDAAGATARDLRHRVQGLAAEARSRLRPEAVSDDVLVERVRAKLGRVVSHPGSIEVTARDGRVALSGPVLASEVDRLVSSVSSVRGVREVESRLEPHEQAGEVSGLQGGITRPGERFDLMQANWSPTTRLAAGLTGASLALYGGRRRGAVGAAAGLAGLAMLARAATNREITRLVGTWAGRRAVRIQKIITIAAPIEDVYDFWSRYENFPRFMANVREVRDTGDGRSHWVVAGPAGVPVEWDAVTTKRVPDRALAWRSTGGSPVASAGTVRFQPNPDGTTRIDVRLSYTPPAGAVGHGAAALFGADPKREMDEDLMRMKTLIETEHGLPTPVRAGAPRRQGRRPVEVTP